MKSQDTLICCEHPCENREGGKEERASAPCLWFGAALTAVYWDGAAVRKVGVLEEVWEDVHPGLLD